MASCGRRSPEGDEDGGHGKQPLTNLDEMITALKMVEKYIV